MSVNSLYCSVFVLCVFLSTKLAICTDFVPVYLWETTKTEEIVPALPRINRETFKEIVKERLVKDPLVVVFAEPSLSPEDFNEIDISGKKTFPYLSDIKSVAHATYLPLVENPVSVIKHLHKPEVTQVTLKNFISNPVIPKDRLLIIELNDVKDDEDRTTMLHRHDSSIKSIYNQLSKNETVLALFTAYQSSWIIPEEVIDPHQARNILAEEEETPTTTNPDLFNTTNLLLYVTDMISVIGTKENCTLTSSTAVTETANITASSVVVQIKDESKCGVEMSFLFGGGNWKLDDITVTDYTNNSNVIKLVPRSIAAPVQFSYQCTSQVFYSRENPPTYMTLPGMQMQPFLNAPNSTGFGDAYFCVGFTTAPIWSGLFVTFILAIIMAIGLSMMLDIRTMDRFDDPKGKTIIINASE